MDPAPWAIAAHIGIVEKVQSSQPLSSADLAELFRWLTGTWQLEREFAAYGRGAGRADFTPVPEHAGTLHYAEHLRFALAANGRLYEGTREFRYHLDGDRLAITFWEEPRRGSAYLRLTVTATADGGFGANGRHPCGEDVYEHAFRWHPAADRFLTDVSIVGPRRHHRVLTHYRRHRPGNARAPASATTRHTAHPPALPTTTATPAPGSMTATTTSPVTDRQR